MAALLANIATGSASQVAGLPSLPGVQQNPGSLGGIGQAAGGIGSLISALSDVRLKKNIVQIGQTPKGHKLYRWDWTIPNIDQPNVGVIAQEAAKIQPEVIVDKGDGLLRVNYEMVA